MSSGNFSRYRDITSRQWHRKARGPNGRGLCRVCVKEVPVGRQAFCSDDCVSKFRQAKDGNFIRDKVLEIPMSYFDSCTKHEFFTGDAEDTITRELGFGMVSATVISPPYFGVRDYQAGPGEIGKESTPEEYGERMEKVFKAIFRASMAHATLWVVIGDSYSNAGPGKKTAGFPAKTLLDIPGIIMVAMRSAGWRPRAEIIWFKTNGFPESAGDRPSRNHEKIIMASIYPTYFFDKEILRQAGLHRTVWPIKKGFNYKRTATFPIEIPAACIAAGCPLWTCHCGAPWKRKFRLGALDIERARYCGADKKGEYHGTDQKDYAAAKSQSPAEIKRRILQNSMRKKEDLGWFPTCSCRVPGKIPGVVMDCFAGSGTTGIAARALGRSSILIDLDPLAISDCRDRLSGPAPIIKLDLGQPGTEKKIEKRP